MLVLDEFGFLVYKSEEFPANVTASTIHEIYHKNGNQGAVTYEPLKGYSLQSI
jgi:hypothetical protein